MGSRLVRPVLVFAGMLVPMLAGWAMLGREGAQVVKTVTATAIETPRGVAAILDASGYVVARRVATVSAKTTGRIREVRIEEGQQVLAGDVMALLDSVEADAQHALAIAQLDVTDSQLEDLQVRLVEAEANSQRFITLLERQLVPQVEYDQAVTKRDSLRAQLATAKHNREVAARQLRVAQIGVDNTVVRAPFAGVVVTKAAQPGEIVSPLSSGGFTRTGIGTIVDTDNAAA